MQPSDKRLLMARFKSRDTKPEMVTRRALHAMGFRFRLHQRDLPGRPDIVLPRHRIAIQVHGCFWHRHEGCRIATMPSLNLDFWHSKFEKNVGRDLKTSTALVALGWHVAVVWECETKDAQILHAKLISIMKRTQ